MKIGDLVRWIDNEWTGIVLEFRDDVFVVCLLAHDSSTCTFVRYELEVINESR